MTLPVRSRSDLASVFPILSPMNRTSSAAVFACAAFGTRTFVPRPCEPPALAEAGSARAMSSLTSVSPSRTARRRSRVTARPCCWPEIRRFLSPKT